MRNRIITILSAVGLLTLAACDSYDSDPKLTGMVQSALDPLPSGEYVLTNPGDKDPVLFTATWTEAMFYLEGSSTPTPVAPVSYTLQVDKAGNGFDEPRTLASASSLAAKIYTKEFNLVMLDSLGGKAGEEMGVELRLKVSYGQGLTRTAYSSNAIVLNVTPFQDRDPLQPVYIIGTFNSWNTTATAGMLPMFKENSETTNHTYTFTGFLPAGCDFKFLPSEAKGTSKAYGDAGSNALDYSEASAALHNTDAGFKTITINLRTLAYSIADYDASAAPSFTIMGFIGAFCSWDSEPTMTRHSSDNSHIWLLSYTLPALGSNETHPVKFRAERDWLKRWAAIDPEAVPYGKTMYLTGDEYDPNIVVRSGGDYQITFNDLTGHYMIYKQ